MSGEYDEIDLPVFTPVVRRHWRLVVIRPCCCKRVQAPLPDAAHGSPFGPRLHALVVYLKTFQSMSFARLEQMFGDVFGLQVSQGMLAQLDFVRRAETIHFLGPPGTGKSYLTTALGVARLKCSSLNLI